MVEGAYDLEDFGVLGLEVGVVDLRNEGEDGVVGRERLSQAPRRCIGVVGVGMVGVGGVMGLESKGPLKVRAGGARVNRVVWRERFPGPGGGGGVGRGFDASGTEKAEPMSESVSERTCMRREGAMAGTWEEGEGGGRLMKAGDWFAER